VIASTIIFIVLVAVPYFLFVFTVVRVGPDGIPMIESPFTVERHVSAALGRNYFPFEDGLVGTMVFAYFVGLTIGIQGFVRAVRYGSGKVASSIPPLLYVALAVFMIVHAA